MTDQISWRRRGRQCPGEDRHSPWTGTGTPTAPPHGHFTPYRYNATQTIPHIAPPETLHTSWTLHPIYTASHTDTPYPSPRCIPKCTRPHSTRRLLSFMAALLAAASVMVETQKAAPQGAHVAVPERLVPAGDSKKCHHTPSCHPPDGPPWPSSWGHRTQSRKAPTQRGGEKGTWCVHMDRQMDKRVVGQGSRERQSERWQHEVAGSERLQAEVAGTDR